MFSTSVHWKLRGIAVAVAVLAASLGASAREDDGATTGYEGCTRQCGSGSGVGCGDDQHKVWTSGDDRNAGGNTHSSCFQLSCDDSEAHDCTLEGLNPLVTLGAVSSAVEAADAQTLIQLLTERPKTVQLNAGREAFQVTNCSGNVIGHLPATEGLLSTVANAVRSNN